MFRLGLPPTASDRWKQENQLFCRKREGVRRRRFVVGFHLLGEDTAERKASYRVHTARAA